MLLKSHFLQEPSKIFKLAYFNEKYTYILNTYTINKMKYIDKI